MTKILSVTLVSMLFSTFAFAWGERGHHTVGYAAALAIQSALSTGEKAKIGTFFTDRTLQLGHLSNIPDISWKDGRHPLMVKINSPTHYLDSEILLGVPEKGYDDAYSEKIRGLEKNYEVLRARYNGKPNPLPGAAKKTINVFHDVGTAPWRVQELYNLMIEALKCAEGKAVVKTYRSGKDFKDPFVHSNFYKTPVYKCDPKATRFESLYAAITIGGIMGHFIGDLSQPYHVTADFDGWTTGQGGVHAYFETFVVQGLDEDFRNDVVKKSVNTSMNEKIWKRLAGDPKDKYFAVQTALNLAAESIKLNPLLKKLDREVAVIQEGDKMPLGGQFGKKPAERKSRFDENVVKKLRPIITDQISIASVVLSHLWAEAWRQAGSPDLSDVSLIAIPYPVDVPFLWPSYLGKDLNAR